MGKKLQVTVVSNSQKERDVDEDEHPGGRQRGLPPARQAPSTVTTSGAMPSGIGGAPPQSIIDHKAQYERMSRRSRSRSPARERRELSPARSPPPKVSGEELDALYFKTKTKPHLYWRKAP